MSAHRERTLIGTSSLSHRRQIRASVAALNAANPVTQACASKSGQPGLQPGQLQHEAQDNDEHVEDDEHGQRGRPDYRPYEEHGSTPAGGRSLADQKPGDGGQGCLSRDERDRGPWRNVPRRYRRTSDQEDAIGDHPDHEGDACAGRQREADASAIAR